MQPRRYTFPDTRRAVISEFIATLIFVFAAEGSVLTLGKIYKDTGTSGGMVAVALAHALGLSAAVAASVNVSGGHVNPAVTLGALIGGRISLGCSVYYCIAQILGAVIASILLQITTGGMRPVGFSVASGIGEWHAVLLEAVMTFGLVYATAIGPKRGNLTTVTPVVVGFVFGANILAGGPFDGAAMNPARAFGPAFVGWRWRHQWVYWVGPFVGATLAALIYEFLVILEEPPLSHHQPLALQDY